MDKHTVEESTEPHPIGPFQQNTGIALEENYGKNLESDGVVETVSIVWGQSEVLDYIVVSVEKLPAFVD